MSITQPEHKFHIEAPASPSEIIAGRIITVSGWYASNHAISRIEIHAGDFQFEAMISHRKDCRKIIQPPYTSCFGFTAQIDSAVIDDAAEFCFQVVCYANENKVASQEFSIPLPARLVGAPQFVRSRCMILVTSPNKKADIKNQDSIDISGWIGSETVPINVVAEQDGKHYPITLNTSDIPANIHQRFHGKYPEVMKFHGSIPLPEDPSEAALLGQILVTNTSDKLIAREQLRVSFQPETPSISTPAYNRSSKHDELLVFHHLEKTAGTTIRHIIARQYEAEEIYYLYNGEPQFRGFQDFKLLTAEQQQRINIILGHNTRSVESYLYRPYRAATFLREPVDRLMSLYAFVKRHKETPLNKVLKKNKLNFPDFVTRIHELSGIGYAGTDNSLVRKISGISAKVGQCHDEMLEVAISNIERDYPVVGLVEKFDESLLLMRRMFGWRSPFYTKSNVSSNRKKRAALPAEEYEQILPYTRLDVELYNYCMQRIETQIAEGGQSFVNELSEFQKANQSAENWL